MAKDVAISIASQTDAATATAALRSAVHVHYWHGLSIPNIAREGVKSFRTNRKAAPLAVHPRPRLGGQKPR
jgi:hypothetical protein